MRILVAVDGSECSMKAVEFLMERPWNSEDQFLVLSVVEPIPQEFGLGVMPPATGGIEERMYDECAEFCGKAAARIQSALPSNLVEVKVANGLVAETICRHAAAWNADLIMLGSHGRKGITHFLLGSVAEEVLKSSPCSVEVVKAKKTGLEKEARGQRGMEKTGAKSKSAAK